MFLSARDEYRSPDASGVERRSHPGPALVAAITLDAV
jgi:hypothetical protein